jgi:hypothetical protein
VILGSTLPSIVVATPQDRILAVAHPSSSIGSACLGVENEAALLSLFGDLQKWEDFMFDATVAAKSGAEYRELKEALLVRRGTAPYSSKRRATLTDVSLEREGTVRARESQNERFHPTKY